MNVLITYTVIQVHLIQWHEFSVFNHPQCSIREPAGTLSDDNLWQWSLIRHRSYCFWTQHVPVVVFVTMQMFCWVCFRGPVPDVRTWRLCQWRWREDPAWRDDVTGGCSSGFKKVEQEVEIRLFAFGPKMTQSAPAAKQWDTISTVHQYQYNMRMIYTFSATYLMSASPPQILLITLHLPPPYCVWVCLWVHEATDSLKVTVTLITVYMLCH